MSEAQITATRSQIAAAFKEWDETAKAENWTDRDDENRHTENADFLMALLRKHGAG